MTAIPSTFTFMNQQWSIQPAQYNELKDDMGECDPRLNVIKLDPSLPQPVLVQTLMHEIIHAWEITLQLDMPERTVDLIALSMIHFFKTNPKFTELFLDAGQEVSADETQR